MTGLLLALALDAGMIQEAIEALAPAIDEVFDSEVAKVFAPALKVFLKAGERSRAYDEFQREMGRAESAMTLSDAVTTLEVLGNRFYFDAEGYLWYDDRFVRPDERPAIDAVSEFYRRHFMEKGKATSPKKRSVGEKRTGKPPPVPVFRGYEDARYQQYDRLILEYVADFNANRGEWAAATPGQAALVHDLSPALVKSQMIEESGGWDGRSVAAWKVDPQQVNVPGDWSPYKSLLGLTEPKRRNEGTAEQNVKAAIMFLARKGFGTSGRPASHRPEGRFDGWHRALERYNGRNDETADGRLYRDAYADRILRRALEPRSFVPISIKVKSKKQMSGPDPVFTGKEHRNKEDKP